MNKWEYKTIKLELKGFAKQRLDIEEFDYELNKLGHDGWELVSFFTNSVNGFTKDMVGIFKRRKA